MTKAIWIIVLLRFLGLEPSNYAMYDWQQRTIGQDNPEPRITNLVYDNHRNKVLMIGGYGVDPYNDMYHYDNNLDQWVRLPDFPPAIAPVVFPAVVFSQKTNQVIMHGGTPIYPSASIPSPYTWIMEPDAGWVWSTEKSSYDTASVSHAYAYDPFRQRMVIFGGLKGHGVFHSDEVWEFDPWEQEWSAGLTPPPLYGPRRHMSAAFDPVRGGIVLYGGLDSDRKGRGDTWLYTGSQWVVIDLGLSGPPARFGSAMAYDYKRGYMVMFGGSSTKGFTYQDTWFLKDTGWELFDSAVNMPAVFAPSMCPGPGANGVILFGGTRGLLNYSDKTYILRGQ